MADEELPDIPIVCETCGTRSKIPFDDVEATVERHNEQRHDGEEMAQVDPAVMELLADRVAEDIGLL